MTTPTIDEMLANLQDGKKSDDSSTDKLIALKKLEMQEKREEREAAEKERLRSEERAGKSDMLKTVLTIFAPVVVGMMNKPAIDPSLLAIITGKNSGEEMKTFLEMQRQQAAMQMETMTKSMLHIMEVKDAMNERIMEKAVEAAESGENDSGILGVLTQVAKIAGPLMNAQPAQAAQPAQGQHVPQGQPAQPARRIEAPAAPALVVLRTLKNIHQGAMTDKQLRMAKASLVVVILQDDALVAALLSDDKDALVSYCAPIVMGDKALNDWITLPSLGGNLSPAEWLVEFVQNELVPRVDYEINGDQDDNADDTDDAKSGSPEELNASNTTT